ncbi:MAG: LysR family transcriptional regulator [Chloroflexota bacterium]
MHRLNSITLAQLRIFIGVADTGSFTEAAYELDMTQSAVSHAVSSLEKALGEQLLTRGRQGAQLTAIGGKVLVHARKSLHAALAIEQEIGQKNQQLSGTLTVSSFRSAATYLIPPVISRFKKEHPNVDVIVDSIEGKIGWIERSLIDGKSDVGITAMPIQTNLMTWELFEDEFVILAPRSEAHEPFTWEKLESMPLILCGEDCTAPVLAHWKRNGRKLLGYQRVPEDSVVISMVEHGLGYSILPRLATEPLPDTVAACALPLPLVRRIGVAISPERLNSPLVSAFVQAMRDTEFLTQNSLVQNNILSLIA